METKKNFSTIEEVCDYLNEKCYSRYTNTYEERDGKFTHSLDYKEELENIEVEGMEKFLPQDEGYDISSGLDSVVAIFANEDKIEYVWQTSDFHDFNKLEYDAMAVDRKEIANALTEYIKYVKDGGCFDVSTWIFEEYCDIMLSISYDVMTTIGRIER